METLETVIHRIRSKHLLKTERERELIFNIKMPDMKPMQYYLLKGIGDEIEKFMVDRVVNHGEVKNIAIYVKVT